MLQRLGRYEIQGEIGRGGMGIVYRGLDPAIGRVVAIKTIRLAMDARPEETAKLQDRLMRESRAAGVLTHPNIVAVYDVGKEGDTFFIVLEYVDGKTLEQMMRETPGFGSAPSTWNTVIRMLADIAAALDFAHAKGIVHRDVKPDNILVKADGTVKISDFGIAKVSNTSTITETAGVVGSPHYMAPEQLRGSSVAGTTDQFALATLAYALLAGQRPFEGETLATLVTRTLYSDPEPAHTINAALPGPVDTVLRQALSKDPKHRFPTCFAFVDALRTSLAGQAVSGTAPTLEHATPPMPSGNPTIVKQPIPPAAPLPPTGVLPASPKPRPNFGLVWALVLSILILAALGFYVLSKKREDGNLKEAAVTSEPLKLPDPPRPDPPKKEDPDDDEDKPSETKPAETAPAAPETGCSSSLTVLAADELAGCTSEMAQKNLYPITAAAVIDNGTPRILAAFASGVEHNLTAMVPFSDRNEAFSEVRREGFRQDSVSVYQASDGPRLTSIWTKRSGAFTVAGRIKGEVFPKVDEQRRNKGFINTDMTGFRLDGANYFSAIWTQQPGESQTLFDLTVADAERQLTEYPRQGYRLWRLSVYPTSSGVRYAQIWHRGDGAPWVAVLRMTLATFQQRNAELSAKGYRLHHVAASGSEVCAIWYQ